MPLPSELDRKWRELTDLCVQEAEYLSENRHPKVLRLLTDQINSVAAELGFSDRQIKTREFRSEKKNGHVVRMITDKDG